MLLCQGGTTSPPPVHFLPPEDDDLAKDKPLAAAEMHAQRCANMDIKGCSTGPAWGEEDEGSDARVPAKDTFPSLPTSPSAQPVQDNSSSDEGAVAHEECTWGFRLGMAEVAHILP